MRPEVTTRTSAVVLAALAMMGLGPHAAPPTHTTSLGVVGRSNATPWVAGGGSLVAVAWGASVEGKTDVFVAVSHDSGQTFGAPVQVNTIPGEARLGGELPPRVAVTSGRGSSQPGDRRAMDGARSGHLHQDCAVERRRQDVRATRRASGGQCRRRSGVAIACARQPRNRARDLAGSSRTGVGTRGRREPGSSKRRCARRSGHGAEVRAVLRLWNGERWGRARAGKGRLLLLQTALAAGADQSVYAAWRHVYRGTSGISPSRSRATEADRLPRPFE